MKKSAVIFVHEAKEDSALFGSILQERGFTLDNIYRFERDAIHDAVEADLLLVMGGTMGVYEADLFPFLHNEIRVLEERLTLDRPTLGICLGAQLMARALGGGVHKGSQGKEIGWHEITIPKAGQDHPVRHLEGMMFHWHGDTFDLPEHATLLGSSRLYEHQAFRYGEHTLGLQCHPEVTAEQLEGWYEGFAGDYDGENVSQALEKLKSDTAQYCAALNIRSRRFFEEWLESVGL